MVTFTLKIRMMFYSHKSEYTVPQLFYNLTQLSAVVYRFDIYIAAL